MNYWLSILTCSAVVWGGLIAAPKVIEVADTKARAHYHQEFEEDYLEPLRRKVERLEADQEMLEADQHVAIAQHQQEIDSLNEMIELVERDSLDMRLEMSYGNSELMHSLSSGDAVVISFPASVRCEPTEFGHKATVMPANNANGETWIYTNLGQCFESASALPANSRIGTMGQYEVGVLRTLPPS